MKATRLVAMGSVWALAAAALAAGEKRLTYQAEELVKDSKYYLDRLDTAAKDLEKQTAAMTVGDASIQIQKVEGLLGTKQQTDQYMDNVEKRLTALKPVAEHSKVKEQADRVKPIKDSLAASFKKLEDVKASLAGAVAQGSGPQFSADGKRLQELAGMFAAAEQNLQAPDRVIDVARQRDAAVAERKRFGEHYAPLLQQSTGEATQLKGLLGHFDQTLAAYDAAAARYVTDAPRTVGNLIDRATRTAKEGVSRKKPAYFGETGGVAHQLQQAAKAVDLLAVLSPKGSVTQDLQAKLKAAQDDVGRMRTELSDAIVAANECPADAYRGADHDALVEAVRKQWAAGGVAGDVLKVGINGTEWTRTTRWSWSNDTWYKVDTSLQQGFVVLKKTDKLAAVYHVNLVKDHMAGDKITASLFDDPKAEPDVTRMVELSKVK